MTVSLVKGQRLSWLFLVVHLRLLRGKALGHLKCQEADFEFMINCVTLIWLPETDKQHEAT